MLAFHLTTVAVYVVSIQVFAGLATQAALEAVAFLYMSIGAFVAGNARLLGTGRKAFDTPGFSGYDRFATLITETLLSALLIDLVFSCPSIFPALGTPRKLWRVNRIATADTQAFCATYVKSCLLSRVFLVGTRLARLASGSSRVLVTPVTDYHGYTSCPI